MTVVERLLHLRSGDFHRGLPLFTYYFLIIASSQIGQVVRDALFLDQFKAVHLPYVDITVSVLVGFVVALYIRIGQHVNLRDLLFGSLCFYAANLLLLWWAVHFYQWPWLYLVLYVWVGIFGVLAPAQVWTLANFVWTTREAKRRFGMLGSGGISGGIFAGFFSVRIARSFGTESLLPVMAFMLIIAALVVAAIWKQSQGSQTEGFVVADGPRTLQDSFRLILQSPHLQSIAALICLSSMVTTTAAWQMKAIAQQTFVGKDALSIFFGQFDGFTGIFALLAQLLLTGKLLNRFGIGAALMTLPLSLLASSFVIVMSGTLWAACLVKGSDRTFRYSIDTSAQQLLYLPVPSKVKLQVKSFIDTVVWRFGGGFAGLLILIFATTLGLGPGEIGWLNILLVLVWLVAAFVARYQYVATLGHSIQQFELDPIEGAVPMLDRSTTNVLMAKLKSSDPGEILHALDLFEMGHHTQVYAAVRELLDHPSSEIRAKAVSILSLAGDSSVRYQVKNLLRDESLEVRTEALSYLSRNDHVDPLSLIEELGKFADSSICSAAIAFLARPGETQNLVAARFMLDGMVNDSGPDGISSRKAAAQLVGMLPDQFEPQLAKLLEDPDTEVVRHAIRAVGKLRKEEFVSLILARLIDPSLALDAMDTLATFKDLIIGILVDQLCDPNAPIQLRREMPGVLLRIGTVEAAKALADNLLQADSVLRYRITVALNKLVELHRSLPLDREFIETVMVAEIMGHYRSYQIFAMLRGHGDRLLKDSIDREVERIFRLMKVLYPSVDLENAYRGIQSRDRVAHANALEFLENTLSPSLRTLLLPVLDSEVSPGERMRLADRFLNTKLTSKEEAIAALVHTEDPWLKSCAAYAIKKLGLLKFQPDIERWSHDPDPLLRRRIAEVQALP